MKCVRCVLCRWRPKSRGAIGWYCVRFGDRQRGLPNPCSTDTYTLCVHEVWNLDIVHWYHVVERIMQVVKWCPKNNPLRLVLGSLKGNQPAKNLKMYGAQEDDDGRIYVNV